MQLLQREVSPYWVSGAHIPKIRILNDILCLGSLVIYIKVSVYTTQKTHAVSQCTDNRYWYRRWHGGPGLVAFCRMLRDQLQSLEKHNATA